MKSIVAAFFILICTTSFAQQTQPIIIGKADAFHSVILNEKREVLVYTPKSWDGVNRTISYPVLYLLDGYDFFHSVTGIVQYLSSIGKMPEMIVVAISNTDRRRDLTPTHYTKWSNGEEDLEGLKNTGGGEKFTSFIQSELIPRIDSLYPTAPYRMFIGHSLGGLTVVNTLLHHPEMFNSFVAIDPTIWWDNNLMIRQSGSILSKKDYVGKKLFFATANTMNQGMDTLRVVKDTVHGNNNVRISYKFRDVLAKNKKSNLSWNWKYYNDDNHASVPLIAEYDALRFIFKDYALTKALEDPSVDMSFIESHYRKVSKAMGYTFLPPAGTINNLGYISLEKKQFDKAYQYFKKNVENYPDNFNWHDSLGDYYIAIGDKKNAIASITRALALKDYSAGHQKLKELKEGK